MADLHALTDRVAPKELADNTIEMTATILAAGLRPREVDHLEPGPRAGA